MSGRGDYLERVEEAEENRRFDALLLAISNESRLNDSDMQFYFDRVTRPVSDGLNGPSTWRHIGGGGLYRIVTLSLWEASLTPLVTYQALTRSSSFAFTRSMEEFLLKFQRVRQVSSWEPV